MIAQNAPCSRSEFHRRAKMAYPFLTDENIAKLIAREHVRAIREPGKYLKFDVQSWQDLEQYVATRSRQYQRMQDVAGRVGCVMGGAR